MSKGKQILQLSRSKDFLVITESKFEDGFATETRRAIIALDPSVSNKQVLLEKARQYHWHMSEELDQNGFASATRGEKLAEGEEAIVSDKDVETA